jgi:SAM-dependent methyltransferase
VSDPVRSKTVRIDCPVCGGARSEPVNKLNGWQLERCVDCSLVFVNPRPPEAVLLNLYAADPAHDAKLPACAEAHRSYYERGHQEDANETRESVQRLLRLSGRSPESCRLLDFGCGTGELLFEAQRLGLDAHGYDVGHWSRRQLARRSLEDRVFVGRLEDGPYHRGQFDVIHSHAVFEHLYRPARTLYRLVELLRPGGLIALTGIPNFRSLFIHLGIDSFDGNVPLVHLSFFTETSLRRLFSTSSLTDIRTTTWGVPLRLNLPGRSRYLGSEEELGTSEWRDAVVQGKIGRFSRRLGVYSGFRRALNGMLGIVGGGAVIDVVAYKPGS